MTDTATVTHWYGEPIETLTDEELVEVIDQLQTDIFELHDPEALSPDFGRAHLIAAINALMTRWQDFYSLENLNARCMAQARVKNGVCNGA